MGIIKSGKKENRKGNEVMSENLRCLLKQYVNDVCQIYGSDLKSILLYGSYARGDFKESSDIDIMILVDSSDEEIQKKSHLLSDLTFEYNYDYDLMIMPIVKNRTHFNKWRRAYPFYHEVQVEGVELYAV